MTLAFPNQSRSYDETRHAVRFTGHDGMFEVRFFVDVGALSNRDSEAFSNRTPEADCLSAFDDARTNIQAAALKAYSKGRSNIFTLTAADFR